MTFIVGRGLAPAAVLFGQPRTSVPTVKNKRLFSLIPKSVASARQERYSRERKE